MQFSCASWSSAVAAVVWPHHRCRLDNPQAALLDSDEALTLASSWIKAHYYKWVQLLLWQAQLSDLYTVYAVAQPNTEARLPFLVMLLVWEGESVSPS